VDHASHGRLELSLGAAWFDQEHDKFGIPFPSTGERFDLLEDALEIVTRLYTGEVVSYDGKVVSLQDAQLRPVPRAATAPADLDRWQRSQAVAPAGGPLRRCLARLGHAQIRCGRRTTASTSWPRRRDGTRPRSCGPHPCRSTTSTPPASMRASGATAGYGYLVCGWPGAGRDQIERFAREVIPDFS
jgi:hypothetical protein